MKIFLTEEQFKKYLKMLIKENNNCEGINIRDNVAYYKPKQFNKTFDTHMFDDNKNLKVIKKKLPKSNVLSFNLFSGMNPKISKLLKHGTDVSGDNKITNDPSMDIFYDKITMYASRVIKEYLPDADYILIPSSSSDLNTRVAKSIQSKIGGTNFNFFIPDAFVKNVQTIEIDREWLEKNPEGIGTLTSAEISTLERTLSKWKTIDEPIRGFRRTIEVLEKEIEELKNSKSEKRGRPSREITDREKQIDGYENAIFALRHSGVILGKDSTKYPNGKVKEWQIKALAGKTRKAIKGFMQLNSKYVSKLSGKKIVIFDDNLSSGATMDDCCLALQKIGVNMKDIIIITLGIMNPTAYVNSDRTSSRIEP